MKLMGMVKFVRWKKWYLAEPKISYVPLNWTFTYLQILIILKTFLVTQSSLNDLKSSVL